MTLSLLLSISLGKTDCYNLDQGEFSGAAIKRSRVTDSRETIKYRTATSSAPDPQFSSTDSDDDECVHFEPLQIPCEINGFIIPAIVDTGAQVTVMSESCAKRCHISDQIDGRYSGKAVGIGSSDILGRINDLSMRVGPVSYLNKVSILRQSRVDLIIGLDFLRRFGAEINLEKRMLKLQVRGKVVRIPFICDINEEFEIRPPKYEYLSARDTSTPVSSIDDCDEEEEMMFNDDVSDDIDDKRDHQDFSKQRRQDASEPRRLVGQSTIGKIHQRDRELVILNSKVKSHQNYSEDCDDDDEDEDDGSKSFLSMEGV